jgi:hypothetical protein
MKSVLTWLGFASALAFPPLVAQFASAILVVT